MTDPTAHIALLRAQRDATSDPAVRAALDAAIAAIETTIPLSTNRPDQHIQNTAPNQGAQGIFYGTVYVSGQRGASAEQMLAGYLQRLVQRFGSLPVQGVYQQKAADDTLAINLEQVYTQLATTHMVEREVYEGDALATFDADAYLKRHTGEYVLPGEYRVRTEIHRSINIERNMQDFRYPNVMSFGVGEDLSSLEVQMDHLSTEHLMDLAQESEALLFFGPQLVTDAIAAHPHLVLLGEPGSGKSTALRYLALILAQAGLDASVNLAMQVEGWDKLGEQGRWLPVCLSLLPFARRFVHAADHPCHADDLWNYIATDLEANGRYDGLAAAVHDELANGRVLLLLDGLDEVVGRNARRQVAQAVQSFAAQYPQCRIVVTCRVRAYEGTHNAAWQLPGWPTATLADWTPGQMQHFVQAWYGAAAAASGMSVEKCDERRTALTYAIERRDDLKRLGARPLLLTIMALVHVNDGHLPEERVGLYSRCIDLLLGQWELAKADGSGYGRLTDYIGLPDSDVTALRPLLQQAAFAAHTAGSADTPGSLGRDTLRLMVMETLHQKGHPNPFEGAERFLEYTDVRSGIMQASDAGDSYRFLHLTFQEYLAGLELVRDVNFVQHIMERRHDDRWRVPIQLGIGHLVSEGALAMAYQLLSELVYMDERSEEQRQRDLVFASDLAEDVGWTRLERGGAMSKKLRSDLAQALVTVIEGTVLPPKERVQAGMYLGRLGDPRPGVCTLPPVMVRIDGGEFVMGILPEEVEQARHDIRQHVRAHGYTEPIEWIESLFAEEINDQSVQVAAFEIARFPVTNAQFAIFMREDGYDFAQPWWDEAAREWLSNNDPGIDEPRWRQRPLHRKTPRLWDDPHLGQINPNHPVVGITTYEARAFCCWLTHHTTYNPEFYVYMLPSEEEWEYAARGSERRVYPWGTDDPDAEKGNFNLMLNKKILDIDHPYGSTTPVGCFPQGASPDTLLEMAGNVWELTRSVYASYHSEAIRHEDTHTEPDQQKIVNRGGGWYNAAMFLRTYTRNYLVLGAYYNHIGFRLVRYPPDQKIFDERFQIARL